MIYVLSANRMETNKWARSQGIPLSKVRHVQNVTSLPGVLNPKRTRMVELPSYAKRRDRFGINNRLKNVTRRATIEIEKWYIDPEGNYAQVSPPAVDPEPPVLAIEELVALAEEHEVNTDPPYEEVSYDQGGYLAPGLVEVTNETSKPEAVVNSTEDFMAKVGKTQSEVAIQNLDEVRPASYAEGEGETATVASGLALPAAEKRDAEISEVQDVVEQTRDDLADVADELTAIAQETETISEPAPAEKPKRRARRNNQQIAFDEAFQKYGEQPNEANSKRLGDAREALRKRDANDPRLEGDLPDLDF